MMTASTLFTNFPKRRAFITGAGSGLGLAFAKRLSACGWTLGISDINATSLSVAAEAIRALGGKTEEYVFDITSYDDYSKAVHAFADKYGGIDIGINNAGIGAGSPLDEMPIDTFRRVLEINVMGVVNGCHILVPIMKRDKSGHILNVASAAGFAASPRMSAYNTSKAGVIALSETLRGELFDENISVSCLMPTYVRTNIGKSSLGPAQYNLLAQKFVERSNVSPEQAVEETFQKMERGDLYIVLPGEARFLWRFKRLFPERFWRFVHKEMKKRWLKMGGAAS